MGERRMIAQKKKSYFGLVVSGTYGHVHKIETVTELRCFKMCITS